MSNPFDTPPSPRPVIYHPDCSVIGNPILNARHGRPTDLVPVNNTHNWAFGLFAVTAVILIVVGAIW